MDNVNEGNTDKKEYNFYLDSSLLDLNIVKHIGIENLTNSIKVEIAQHTVMQTIHLEEFAKKTTTPLKKQIEEILLDLQTEEEKKRVVNSIITCINRNVDKIFEYWKEACESRNADPSGENGIVDILVSLALNPENIEKLFKDQYGKPFAAIRLGNDKHLEIMPINGIKFRRYLSILCRNNIGCSSDGLVNTAITNISAEAEFNGEEIPLHLRIAWGSGSEASRSRKDCIYYSMYDSAGKSIELSKEGWKLISGSDHNAPILFKKYNQQPQVEPCRNYPSDILDQLLNLTNVKSPSHRHLLKVYIISTLIPQIDHVILTTYGPKGAAKSFLLELIKKLIDPTKPTLLTLHRNIEQFIQQVNHNYINYYDNVKFIPYWLSDEICKAVTGIGHTKRQLFTDDEDIIYENKRPLGLNGINVALTEPDALDRSISIELKEIDDEYRKKEEDLWAEFERIKSQVFGYILDIIVKAMQIKPTLNLKKLPRMADFTEWSEAISQAMGYPPMSFMKVYAENRNELNIVAVNESLVGSLFLKYLHDFESQYGPISEIKYEPEELRKNLVDFAENNGIATGGRYFPKDAGNLVKKLKTVAPNIKAGYGVIIEVGRNTATNTSVITVSRKTIVENKVISYSGASESPEVISKSSMNTNDHKSVENCDSINDRHKKDLDDSSTSMDLNNGDRNDG